ncbi:MAG: zinc-ribbon domain-containing protein [Candidatus Spyradocola sp.]
MFCTNCGSKIDDNAPFCSFCGAKLGASGDSGYESDIESIVDSAGEPAVKSRITRPEPEQPASSAPYYSEPSAPQSAPGYTPPPAQPAPAKTPSDFLAIHIVLCVASTVLWWMCLPIASLVTSIIGIVTACSCRNAIKAGDWATAKAKSRTSRNLWIASAIVLGLLLLYVVVVFILGVVYAVR